MSESKLLPCPFCGGEASSRGRTTYSGKTHAWWEDGSPVLKSFHVNCMICGVSNQGLLGYQTVDEAIAKWNRRWSA